jgi:predicted transposase/invertase (TIGR01784 family)
MQQELLDFCTGKNGLRVTYDPVFRKIFKPELHQDRLESLLSAILQRQVTIMKILPREGTHLTEKGSFVIMDILVQLDDCSYANVEMQKIGYNFPLARADCYASDIIMRQYEQVKAEWKDNFSFSKLQKVYCIILMEKSPTPFHETDRCIHTRTSSFDTGIYQGNAGLHEDIFICLDTFQSIVHTMIKGCSMQEAWLTFLSSTDVQAISALVAEFPMFLPIYQEITDFAKKPEELMNMFSEALYIMDRNMERMMVEEWKEAAETAQAQLQESELKAEIFRLRLTGKTPEETAAELSVPIEKVNEILATV